MPARPSYGHEDARKWAIATERRIDLGEAPRKAAARDPTLFAHLVDLHVQDMCEVGKAPRRSKQFTLDALKAKLGKVKLKDLSRECLIQFGKDRAKEGAGPVTLNADFGYLKLVITHAAAVHGMDVRVEPVDLARVALKRLGLVGKSRQRDRRPTRGEIKRLLRHFDESQTLLIPMGRIVRFAIASAMRQEEICRIRWSDVDVENHMVLVRDRKDPREKDGNDQPVPLLSLAAESAAGTEANYTPTIRVLVDLDQNSLTVTDNGIGLDKDKSEQFLAPNFSFKSGKTRGHKGVSATYVAYGFNYMRISTKTPGFSASGRIIGARNWLKSNASRESSCAAAPETTHHGIVLKKKAGGEPPSVTPITGQRVCFHGLRRGSNHRPAGGETMPDCSGMDASLRVPLL